MLDYQERMFNEFKELNEHRDKPSVRAVGELLVRDNSTCRLAEI